MARSAALPAEHRGLDLSHERSTPHATLGRARFRLGDLEVDAVSREVSVAGKPIALTRLEFSLLLALCHHAGRALRRETLSQLVWGTRTARSATMDIHVCRLRSKLGPALRLETVRGFGYRLRAS